MLYKCFLYRYENDWKYFIWTGQHRPKPDDHARHSYWRRVNILFPNIRLEMHLKFLHRNKHERKEQDEDGKENDHYSDTSSDYTSFDSDSKFLGLKWCSR